ncbi:hypothetical protein Pcinc_015563 [Petrolisthes cinctipes]|uniref:Major facilitator superfamily (MFS) profile domain-containing protein n=1 Tax=Petrolisthes cinctipes TaxID=88211 RepID=A0AAE1FUM4_PETCI|nr:hypothetical protein Pcinc_020102 [Petrolisthes cinctipes]KAK3879920.1 hypothetical protein Pcinc_015563 [Petrolisthes cinctipes]
MCHTPREHQHTEWEDPHGDSTPLLSSTQSKSWRVLLPPIRYVVVILGLLGCMVDYLVRFGLSVAIVSMVVDTGSPNTSLPLPDGACPAALNNTQHDSVSGEGTFDWTVEQQGIILGIFFWGYFITKMTGGRISEMVGPWQTMAVSLGMSGVLSLLCPFAAHLHPMALASVRLLMGLVQGPSFPALYSVLARWAPPDELATMVTIAYSGMSCGSLVAMGTSGWIIEHLGWEWVFYGGGILSLLWTPLWLAFVRNSPKNHPFVTPQEFSLLSLNIHVKPKRHVPWSRLLRCWRFLPCIMAEFASSWVTTLTTTEGPTFLNAQIGMSLDEVGSVLTVGQTLTWFTALIYGRTSDLLTKNGTLSKINTRRLMHTIGMVLVVLGLCGLAWAGCDKWMVAVLLIVVMVGCPSTLCSFTLAPMDIAPNYAGVC